MKTYPIEGLASANLAQPLPHLGRVHRGERGDHDDQLAHRPLVLYAHPGHFWWHFLKQIHESSAKQNKSTSLDDSKDSYEWS